MKIEYKLDGLSELNNTLKHVGWDIIGATKKGMVQEATEIIEESQVEVPVETGALKASAFVESDAGGNVTFGYGGNNAQVNTLTGKSTDEYMVAVHERLDLSHPVGKAKFLEDPINKRVNSGGDSLISKIRQFFKF